MNKPRARPAGATGRGGGLGGAATRGAAALAACAAFAGGLRAEPIDEIQVWNDGSLGGWEAAAGTGALGNPGDMLTLGFGAQGAPMYESCLAWGPVDHSLRVTNVRFRLWVEGAAPSRAMLCLRSRHSGAVWQLPLPRPEAGGWTDYAAPVAYDAGWSAGPGRDAAAFRLDMLDIDRAGIVLVRGGGTAAQTFGVDAFRLQGLRLHDIVYDPLDSDGDGLPDAFKARYASTPGWSGQADRDDDGDGLTNLEEYIAGTDPTDPRAVFAVETLPPAGRPHAQGVAVRWRAIRYRTYDVWRADDLGSAFTRVAADLFSDPPLQTWVDATATNAGPYFYRVTVRP